MSNQNYSQIFKCPECGTVGSIYLLKVDGEDIIIKQRCPTHGGRSFKILLRNLDKYLPFINDSIFRCYECGKKADLDRLLFTGPFAKLRVVCPTHQNKLPEQKIWSLVYMLARDMITKEEDDTSLEKENNIEATSETIKDDEEIINTETTENQEIINNSLSDMKFCPNCGTKITGEEIYCAGCGTKLI